MAQGAFSRESYKPGQESEQDGSLPPRNQPRRVREREKERKKEIGTQALMEQRCFNDFSVSRCRLWYKKFLMTMIKI